MSFQDELRSLINRYSRENKSNTPDFILVDYITDSLNAFDKATNEREKWYGRRSKLRPPVAADLKQRLEAVERQIEKIRMDVFDPTARNQNP